MHVHAHDILARNKHSLVGITIYAILCHFQQMNVYRNVLHTNAIIETRFLSRQEMKFQVG